MRFLLLLGLITLPFDLMAATSKLSCFGYHGPNASLTTVFTKDIDITGDIQNLQQPFKNYPIIHDFGFKLSVTLNFPQKSQVVILTKGDYTSMSVGTFDGTKLILANSKANENLVTAECGVVTKN